MQAASKGFAVVKDHSALKTVILQLMLDILLLPYNWSGSFEDPLAGFNKQSLKRLQLNIPLIFTDSDYHEQVIFHMNLVVFLPYLIFNNNCYR